MTLFTSKKFAKERKEIKMNIWSNERQTTRKIYLNEHQTYQEKSI